MKQIINKIKTISIGSLYAVFSIAGIAVLISTVPVSADCDTSQLNAKTGADCAQGANTPAEINGEGGVFTTVVNVMLFLVGAIAVIMLIVGGIRYTTSNGDQGAVKAAKDTILYAIIGIIVSILAYAIVNFVVGSFSAT